MKRHHPLTEATLAIVCGGLAFVLLALLYLF